MRWREWRHSLINVPILDFLDYDKTESKEQIQSELGWKDYGGKHYESVFTRFYQGYILPEKFSIDKRTAHLSNLVFSGQITKEEAQLELETPIYPEAQLQLDFPFVLKKLGFSEEEFYHYIDAPIKAHSEFGGSLGIDEYYPALRLLKRVYRLFRK